MPRKNTIRLRRGTAAEWAAVNPILDEGELGLETDTGNLRVGTGTATFNQLSLISGDSLLFEEAGQLRYLQGSTAMVIVDVL